MIQNAKHDQPLVRTMVLGCLFETFKRLRKATYNTEMNVFSRPLVAKMRKLSYKKSLIHYLSLPHATFAPKTVFAVSSRTPPINISSFEEAVCIVAKC